VGEERHWREADALIRLHFVVEGQTEETFVRDLLSIDLQQYGVIADARCIATGGKHGRRYRGGFLSYQHLRRDVALWLKEDQRREARVTSMIDLYRMPRDFPGFNASPRSNPVKRAEFLEAEFARDVGDRRFLPFIRVHEFEVLLFSDPAAFAYAFPGRDDKIAALDGIRKTFASPELIDDGDQTSPAKRICALFPDYDKVAFGAQIACRIGLNAMARECPHFRNWLEALRALC
jgi:hypothetical protein